MSYTVSFHPEVERNYTDAYGWYEDKQPGMGEKFIKAVRKKVEETAHHAETFESNDHATFRETLVDFFPYRIIFRLYENEREIFISSFQYTLEKKIRKKNKENTV